MARKVKLDILENREEPGEEQTEEIGLSPLAETSEDRRSPAVRAGRNWVLAGAVAASLCLVAAGLLLFLVGGEEDKMTPSQFRQPPVAMTKTAPRNISNFDNFIVDFRDAGGNVRVVMFNVAVELVKPVNGEAIEDRVDLRGAIYGLSKKKNLAALLSPEERKGLRNEIAAELEKRLGAGVVKTIYFTKFTVL